MTDGTPFRTALLGLLAAAVVAVVALLGFAPPQPRGAEAEGFSAERAFVHVERVAQRPHPIGTDDNARVRQYIADTATRFGAVVDTETDDVLLARSGVQRLATVHNVVAKVAGTDPRPPRAITLVSHHDSVPTGPGAADDGAAVAAMLETLRTTAANPPRNDVVFLFTDGEELGLLGARAYTERHSVAGPVLNFEARGSGGPVWMFQTGADNADHIEAFAGASSRPIANSLAAAVYTLLPNSTDFTVFTEAGARGLNSAFINEVHDYHSPNDTPETLDRGSLQHHGETMVGLVDDLGDDDLGDDDLGDDDLGGGPGGRAVYFDLFARVLVHYPDALVVPLALVTVGLLVWLLVRARPARLVTTTLAALGTVAGAAALGAAVWFAVALVRPGLEFLPLSEPYNRGWFLGGFTALALAVLVLGVRVLRRRSLTDLLSATTTLTAVLLLAVVFTLPGGSFLFQWPLLAALPALWWVGRERESDTVGVALAIPPVLVAAALFPTVSLSLYTALGTALAAAAMAATLLGALHLIPLLGQFPAPGRAAGALAAVAVLLIATGTALTGFTPTQPRPDSLIYLREPAGATWLSPDPATDPWTVKALGDNPERVDLSDTYPLLGDPVLRAPAPAHDLPAPAAQVLTDATTDRREVSVRVSPAPQSWRTQLTVTSAVTECAVDGTKVDATVPLELYGKRDGATLTCSAPTGATLDLHLADQWIGLPDGPAATAGPRPPDSILVPSGTRPHDCALVTATARF
ncbi:M20/M25/M40 family metallo-hydrolase [Actinokineospora pegani]|uniref:M20/M25/M40 family metallo-hydrolase n=1 Tax=Actinokineospora pegani TaxID=2654637 RepID=UPI0018D31740|nr:M20/M25/M40 family metallo-hydrolase [Actinokineospora pegani]